MFHFDHWWNPAVVDQATARIYRIGQRRSVFVNALYTSDTIEERIADLLKIRRKLFRDVFGELEDKEATNRLSDEDLFGLFNLPVPGNTEEAATGKLSPTEFENLVQRLFAAMGFNVSVTKRTHDGGVDLEGTQLGVGGGRVVVQCKRYAGTVPVNHVRELLGVVSRDPRIVQGFLVTTGRFSTEAQKFSQGQRLRLIDGPELEKHLQQHTRQQPVHPHAPEATGDTNPRPERFNSALAQEVIGMPDDGRKLDYEEARSPDTDAKRLQPRLDNRDRPDQDPKQGAPSGEVDREIWTGG